MQQVQQWGALTPQTNNGGKRVPLMYSDNRRQTFCKGFPFPPPRASCDPALSSLSPCVTRHPLLHHEARSPPPWQSQQLSGGLGCCFELQWPLILTRSQVHLCIVTLPQLRQSSVADEDPSGRPSAPECAGADPRPPAAVLPRLGLWAGRGAVSTRSTGTPSHSSLCHRRSGRTQTRDRKSLCPQCGGRHESAPKPLGLGAVGTSEHRQCPPS